MIVGGAANDKLIAELKNEKNWKWEITTNYEHFKATGESILEVRKVVIAPINKISGQGKTLPVEYTVESHSFKLGEKIHVIDSQSQVEITCNIPK